MSRNGDPGGDRVASGYTTSAVASAAYTINPPAAATPTFSAGRRDLHHRADGDHLRHDRRRNHLLHHQRDHADDGRVYSGAITVSATETLEAIATATGYSTSAVASAAYTINLPAATPTFSVAAGTYTTAQTVTISDTTP